MHTADLDDITRQLNLHTGNLENVFVKWAHGEASEDSVSGEFVQLGNEFISARHRLTKANLPVENLVDVPKELRAILEEALAMDASPEIGTVYDKQIREVMSKLFHQLKSIHTQLKSSGTEKQNASLPKAGNTSSAHTHSTHQQQTHQQQTHQQPQYTHFSHRAPNKSYTQSPNHFSTNTVQHQRNNLGAPQNSAHAPAYPQARSQLPSSTTQEQGKFPPKIPAPKAPKIINPNIPVEQQDNDALSLLQRNGALERQASKRYSTRQMSRIFNGGSAEQMSLPTTGIHKTFSTPEFKESSVVMEHSNLLSTPETPHQSVRRKASNNINRISNPSSQNSSRNSRSGSLQVENGNAGPIVTASTPENNKGALLASPANPNRSSPRFLSDELYVFLRMGKQIRKAKITKPASIAAIRLQFVEVCAFVPSGDEVFPEIMVQDSKTGIDYEVTESTVSDVTEGSLLTLNVKSEKELNTESELKDIKEILKDLITKTEKLGSSGSNRNTIHSQRSQLGVGSPTTTNYSGSKFGSPVLTGDGKFKIEKPSPAAKEVSANKTEILLKEIAKIKQFSNRTIENLQNQVSKLKEDLRELTVSTTTFRTHSTSMSKIRSRVDGESQELLSKFDELADVIETLRTDVSKGVRYKQGEINKVRTQLATWKAEFEAGEAAIIDEEHIWRKNWQDDLNEIVQCQDWSKTIKEMYSDLRTDMDQSIEMFELVCQANSRPRTNAQRAPLMAPPIEPGKEHEANNAVFSEIEALNISSERRVEAMEDAIRRHKSSQILKSEEFVDDLSHFVLTSKLKSNGGYREVERRRQEREQKSRELAELSELEGRKQAEALKQQRKAQRQEAAAKAGKTKTSVTADTDLSLDDTSQDVTFDLGPTVNDPDPKSVTTHISDAEADQLHTSENPK